jgi:hypothetical protein
MSEATVLLFDKIIDFQITNKNKGTKFLVSTPRSGDAVNNKLRGVKPNIVLSGSIPANEVAANVSLRVTNLRLPWALDASCWLQVRAGYADNLSTVFEGQITNSFQEKPSPDGVMVIESLIGHSDAWMFGNISIVDIRSGTSLNSVLNTVAQALNLTLKSYLDDGVTFKPWSWGFVGPINQCVIQLKRMFDFAIRRDANYLVAYPYGSTVISSTVWEPTFVTSVTKDAENITLICPWIPGMLPADLVKINTKYYKQTFGGAQTAAYDTFQCGKIDFEFGTISENKMTALLLASTDKTLGIDTDTAYHVSSMESTQ